MRYVQSVVVPGESIVATATTHWFIYAMPGFWLVLSIVLMILVPIAGLIVLLIAAVLLFRAWLYVYSTELAITSRRIIAKFGFIRRNTVELRHDKVESVHVEQGIVGRLLNFGSIVVTGSGGTRAPIPYIANPLRFRSAALAGVDPKTA